MSIPITGAWQEKAKSRFRSISPRWSSAIAAWVFTLITDDPGLAAVAGRAGVDRIGIDLEVIGKHERQKGLNSRISQHSIADAHRIYPEVASEGRFARVNPIHAESAAEIEAILAAGARVVMLPYFHTLGEVETFVRLVDGRAVTVGLAETVASLAIVEDIMQPGMLDEVHFGFTDLGLQMGKNYLGVLADPRFVTATRRVRSDGIPFGVAGFARPGDTTLPIDPADFIAGVARTGATRALISRSFLRPVLQADQFSADMATLRAFLGTAA